MPDAVKTSRSYDSPRRREQAAATRRAILEAAQRLFEREGYAATSVPAIEAKANLLNVLWDTRLGGGEESIPVLERAWYRRLLAEPDPERKLRILAAQARDVKTRSGALLEVIRNAATADTEIAELWSRIQTKLLDVQRSVVEKLDE